jgi:protein tyrosine phosphatase
MYRVIPLLSLCFEIIECLSKCNHSTLRTLFHYCIAYLYSAGVGRTGTFIALYALYEHGLETGYVDIMAYVLMMRKDRMNMIHTKVSFHIKCKS